MTMGYKIDNGEAQTLTMTYFKFESNNNFLQSGGADFAATDIDISELSVGSHTLSVWFQSEDVWDSNNSQNYVATFTKGIYSINTDVFGSGTVTVKNGNNVVTSATADTELTVILEAGEGYIIYGANIDGVDIDYNTFDRQTQAHWEGTIVMPEGDITIKPVFVKPFAQLYARSEEGKYTITTTCTEVSIPSGQSEYTLGVEIGTDVTLAVTPAEGYAIESVTAQKYDEGRYYDIELTDNNNGTYTFNMPEEEVNVYVEYYKTGGDYDIIAGTEDFKFTFYNEDNVPIKKANEDDEVKVYATPANASNEGMMNYVTVLTVTDADGQSVEVSKENGLYGDQADIFTMPAKAVTVSATLKFRINVPSSGQLQNGTCVVTVGNEPRNYADENEVVTCTVNPAEGYMLTKLMVFYRDMETYETVDVECTKVDETTYTFIMPAKGVTINPMFAPVPSQNSWVAHRAASFASQDDAAKTITITTADQLALLAYNVNYGGKTYEGYTITLSASMINLQDYTWEPIGYVASSGGMGGGIMPPGMGGSSDTGFLGTFDGADGTNNTVCIIKNMNATGGLGVGLFSDVPSGATVKNVFLSYSEVQGEQYVGAIAGSVSGIIENCHVADCNVMFVSPNDYPTGIGGIAGMQSGGSIMGCTVMRTTIYPIDGATFVGGIVGGVSPGMNYATYSEIPATLKDCLFAGNIYKKDGNQFVGAIAGMNKGTNTFTNNYYVNGFDPNATPNTTLQGIGGEDVDGALLAVESENMPSNIGEAGTQYDWNGVRPYAYGLYYNLKYYLSSAAPAGMDITLSSDGDNSTLLSTYNGMSGKVTLNRTFVKDGDWYTICLPFTIGDIATSPLGGDGVELWQMVGYGENGNLTGFDQETGTLTLNFENCKDPDDDSDPDNIVPGVSTLIAGYPYLIRWTNTGGTLVTPAFTDVTISATSPEAETFGDNDEITFTGTFAQQTFDKENRSILFLGAANKLYFPQPDLTSTPSIGAFRAFFRLNGITAGDVATTRLFFGDKESSGIADVDLKSSSRLQRGWYTLDGRKLEGKPTKSGVYVSRGKKVVVK